MYIGCVFLRVLTWHACALTGDCTSITTRKKVYSGQFCANITLFFYFPFPFVFHFFLSPLLFQRKRYIWDLFGASLIANHSIVYSLGHESRVLAYIYLHLSFERKRAFYSLAWGQFGIRICIGMLRRYLFGAGLFIPYPRAFICFMMLGSCLGVWPRCQSAKAMGWGMSRWLCLSRAEYYFLFPFISFFSLFC